ncbi:hypothetical protein PAMP_016715 [Pampus punctatissimus]
MSSRLKDGWTSHQPGHVSLGRMYEVKRESSLASVEAGGSVSSDCFTACGAGCAGQTEVRGRSVLAADVSLKPPTLWFVAVAVGNES